MGGMPHIGLERLKNEGYSRLCVSSGLSTNSNCFRLLPRSIPLNKYSCRFYITAILQKIAAIVRFRQTPFCFSQLPKLSTIVSMLV